MNVKAERVCVREKENPYPGTWRYCTSPIPVPKLLGSCDGAWMEAPTRAQYLTDEPCSFNGVTSCPAGATKRA